MSSPIVSAIRIAHASKSFNRRAKALDDVNATIQQGECVGLLGASGSGKSTLLRSICGLERLDGKDSLVELFGRPLQSAGALSSDIRDLRRQTGIIFQQFNLVGRMDVLSNVLTGLLPRMPLWRSLTARFSRDEQLQALQALESVGLADYAFQRASTLSGGQQQRAAVARALLQGARILLADEPVSALDPESARRVMDLLHHLNRSQGMTLVVSLHNVAMARRYCDRIIALRAGELVFDGSPMELDDIRLRHLYGASTEELLMEHDPLDSPPLPLRQVPVALAA
ncbi:phosphonate ABC transporter ATP-binding protein [Rhodoferax sp. GW822-FHT02A01]|uniref:phosphonate ABC transporter ATP-binding protein n=1 Tax=Rhodoferax sp. GW822-FHT02A01 TaxID=3141537 RepID=UPI00315DBD61